ncbi:MAG: hypothetical protein A4E53_00619 [Pelotomaculum sp. PtaB.Bin104]|nr:MAG: hypothetical protein A4E53_00619 [Pelotomaculum sp. PtaB.Bin104]
MYPMYPVFNIGGGIKVYEISARMQEQIKRYTKPTQTAPVITEEEDQLIPSTAPVTVCGNVIPLHRMRPSCQAAGHCLGLTGERNCSLYPVRLGWCRERTQTK